MEALTALIPIMVVLTTIFNLLFKGYFKTLLGNLAVMAGYVGLLCYTGSQQRGWDGIGFFLVAFGLLALHTIVLCVYSFTVPNKNDTKSPEAGQTRSQQSPAASPQVVDPFFRRHLQEKDNRMNVTAAMAEPENPYADPETDAMVGEDPFPEDFDGEPDMLLL